MGNYWRLVFFFCLLAVPRAGIAATCAWTGGGSDDNWSTAANWDNCGGAHATPQDGDDLVFPGGAARNTPNNNLPTLTVGTIAVNGVPVSGTKAPIVKTYTVPPTSRFNIDVNLVSPDLHDEYFGADVKVTTGPPIIVERSMYWDSGGVLFKGGTNATGVRLP